MTGALHNHVDLYKKNGQWVTVYTDASTGTVDSLHADDVRPENIASELASAGASKPDRKAVDEALRQSAKGIPDPVTRLLLVNDGTVEFDEFLPGALVMPGFSTVGAVPNLAPLVRHRPEDFAYVVAQVGRDGGEIELHRANSLYNDGDSTHVDGSTENLKKVPGGGWSQGGYQHRTENVWKANAAEIADEIDRVVRTCRARVLIIAGDIRARKLVADQVSEASKEILTIIDSHSRTDGADKSAFARKVEECVAENIGRRQAKLLDRLNEQQGHANPESAVGLGAVVHALQQAQVETLLLDTSAWDDHSLLALDAEPWVAAVDSETAGVGVLGKVSASSSLLRAAALTDANIVLFPSGALDSHRIAALLRWPTGPTVPAGS